MAGLVVFSLITTSENGGLGAVKVAVTCLAWSMVTWQGAVPVQDPDQPVN